MADTFMFNMRCVIAHEWTLTLRAESAEEAHQQAWHQMRYGAIPRGAEERITAQHVIPKPLNP